MRILGIETSCDETSAAIVDDGTRTFSNVIASSAHDLCNFGGVVPELAARRQAELMIPVIRTSLEKASSLPSDLDAIAITRGPGLLTSLLVGVSTARLLSSVWKKPLIGIHHTFGHLSSPWLEQKDIIAFPLLTLSVSGGHTDLWFRRSHVEGMLLGTTRDDAAGEAFDKGASLLGLPYPGGPALAALAEGGDCTSMKFPVPLQREKSLDFSFSGLKTALKYALRDVGGITSLSENEKRNLAASFQEIICRHLVDRVSKALKLHPEALEVHLVGGVSANHRLRHLLREQLGTQNRNVTLRIPSRMEFCTDNAAMIAAAGFFLFSAFGNVAFANFTTQASIENTAISRPMDH